MSSFFDDMLQDLTDAIAIEKGDLDTQMLFDSPAPTYIVSETSSSDQN